MVNVNYYYQNSEKMGQVLKFSIKIILIYPKSHNFDL